MKELNTAKDYRDARVALRESIYAKMENVGSIQADQILREEFDRISADAVAGDAVAEDLLAEWYRNGNRVVPENVDFSMQWLILAGANGNKFSLDRLKLHFGYAFDKIVNDKNFGKMAYKHNINEFNYQYVLGKILCDAVVDDLKIDALELAKQKPARLPFSAIIMRKFDDSITKCVDVVLEYLNRP